MNRKAVIDVGSTSVKFLLCEPGSDGCLQTIADELAVTRLGEGLSKSGEISQEAMARTADAVARFADRAKAHGAGELACVGTMALRSAANSARFVELIKESGCKLRIITGLEEARLSYLAALASLRPGRERLVVFDVGGGSTEFSFGEGGNFVRRFSVGLGALSVTENFLHSDPPAREDINSALMEIDSAFAADGVDGTVVLVIGVGGAITNMSAVKQKMAVYDSQAIQGSTLTSEDVRAQIELYGSLNLEKRRQLTGLQPERADLILAGACIALSVLKRFGAGCLTVSDRGLRHGLAHEMFGKNKMS